MSMIITLKPRSDATFLCDFNAIYSPFNVRFHQYIKFCKDTNKKKDSTLRNEFICFQRHFCVFAKKKELLSLTELNFSYVREFASYLSTIITVRGRKLSQSASRMTFSYLKQYCIWLTRYYPAEVAPIEIFNFNPFGNRANERIKTKPLEDSVLRQFKKSLQVETNVYHRACLVLALHQGLRSIDIFGLKDDCLIEDPDNKGEYYLYYYNNKSDRWIKKRTFVSVVRAIKTLIKHTKCLREESDRKELFIHKVELPQHGIVGSIKQYNYHVKKVWLAAFIKKHKIKNCHGELEKINIHRLRSTLASNMDAEGIDVEIAASQLDHKNSSTTMRYYIHSTDETYNKSMDIIDKVVSKIGITQDVSNIDDHEFKENVLALRLADGYCQDTKIATDMNYVCPRFTKRGNCYGCPKMVTTPEFLPYFNDLIKEKKDSLDSLSKYGSHVSRQIEHEIAVVEQIVFKLKSIEKGLSE